MQEALRLHELSKESLTISHNGSIYGNETEKVDEISQVNNFYLANPKWLDDRPCELFVLCELCRFTLS